MNWSHGSCGMNERAAELAELVTEYVATPLVKRTTPWILVCEGVVALRESEK